MITGFIIGGNANKTVVVTAAGPSLGPAGIPNHLPNPQLYVVRASDNMIIATNDNWIFPNNHPLNSGFGPGNALEAAIQASLAPGAYTVVVSGANSRSGMVGVGLVAVYEVDRPDVPLTNLSTRGLVLGGNEIMIGGFVIQGHAPQTVVLHGIGPSLSAHNIANPLANPQITLVRSDNTVVDSNDNWQSAPNAAQMQALMLAPGHPLESAILTTLPPGAYTVLLSGVGGGTGVGQFAVYAVQ